jgi:hypothetical protein
VCSRSRRPNKKVCAMYTTVINPRASVLECCSPLQLSWTPPARTPPYIFNISPRNPLISRLFTGSHWNEKNSPQPPNARDSHNNLCANLHINPTHLRNRTRTASTTSAPVPPKTCTKKSRIRTITLPPPRHPRLSLELWHSLVIAAWTFDIAYAAICQLVFPRCACIFPVPARAIIPSPLRGERDRMRGDSHKR